MDTSWRLAFPWALVLLPVVAAVWLWRRRRREYEPPALAFSTTGWLTGQGRAPWWPGGLVALGFLLLTVSLARPQQGLRQSELESRGVNVGNWRVDQRDGQKLQVFFAVAPDGLCYYFHEPIKN